jgi:hypothetical protein
MEYLVIATTRSHCDLAEPKIAEAFNKSYELLSERKKAGIVKYAALSGPFTPMKTLIVIEAANHEEAYEFITSLPCWCYMDNALFPLIQLESAMKSIKALL